MTWHGRCLYLIELLQSLLLLPRGAKFSAPFFCLLFDDKMLAVVFQFIDGFVNIRQGLMLAGFFKT